MTRADRVVPGLAAALAVLAAVGAGAGLLVGGGSGRVEVETARGATTTLYGHGLYSADTWLVGAGNQGQDVVLLVVEIPVLLAAVMWWRRGGAVAPTVLAGVLSFFTYFYVSMVVATAQNRAFPLYVAAAALAGFALVRVSREIDVVDTASRLPDRPGHRVLAGYLFAVAGALTLAWLPELVLTALSGDIAEAVGPYTSAVTEALDLGVVVPVAVLAAVLTLRGSPAGRVLALVMLVLNVCIGVLLLGQGTAQLVSGVPLTPGEVVAKMLTFAVLTGVAGGLLARMAAQRRR